jgi:FkbM family methyltransferase
MSLVSYAQNFEDVMLWRALKHVENGFYIDIGAQHPVVDSVSLAFYEHGWRGVHVEPTQQYSTLLRAARPDESVFQMAIGNQNERLTFFEFEDTGLSTADAEIAREHQESGFKCRETLVPILSLDALLQQVGARDIHWLKVDVEGLEKEVLESWQSSSNLPWVVVVESTRPLSQEKSHQEWEALLLVKGYSYVYFDGLNRFYVSPEHSELTEAFDAPPNVFDGFVLSGTASQPFYSLVSSRARQAEDRAKVAEDRAQQAEASVKVSEERAKQAEASVKVADDRALQAEAVLSAIHNSRSWQVTRPLRWFAFQTRLLREYGTKARVKAAARKVAVPMLRKTVRFVSARPRLRQRLVALARRTGTYGGIKGLYHRLQRVAGGALTISSANQSLPLPLRQLTPRARKIYADIQVAMEKNKGAV